MNSTQVLRKIVTLAQQRFASLKNKYPYLQGYLVFAAHGRQTRADNSLDEIFKEFPAMFVPDENFFNLSQLIPTIRNKEQQKKAHKLYAKLKFNTNVNIEIRFNKLNYELIKKLQQDPLVNQKLTPQTAASIRIVLGTIAEFASHG